MKYDNNQYHYSPSANYPWFLEDNKPTDAIKMTIAMEDAYEAGINQGFVIKPTATGFEMINPDSLLTPEKLAERDKAQQLAKARSLLNRSITLESGVYQRKMTAEQQVEFADWQDLLLEFIDGEIKEIPDIPEFIQMLLYREP